MTQIERRVDGKAARVNALRAVNHAAKFSPDVLAEPRRFVFSYQIRGRTGARVVEIRPEIVE